MAKLIYTVDDSIVALKVVKTLLEQNVPDMVLRQFQSGADLVNHLNESGELPWIIISDYSMPGMSGLGLLSWIKRHPKFHFLPIAILTAETSDHERQLAMANGAWDYLLKPLKKDQLLKVLANREELSVDAERSAQLDQLFCEETLDRLTELQKVLENLNEEGVRQIFRVFHTIKGSSNTLNLPSIGQFVHLAESFLTAVLSAKLYVLPQAKELLSQIFHYLEDQCDHLTKGVQLEEPPQKIVDSLNLVKANVAAGWFVSEAQVAQAQTSNASQAANASSGIQIPQVKNNQDDKFGGVISRGTTSTRISNTKLDQIQQNLKKIMTLRVRLSTLANHLASEFFDEAFPKELAALIDQLQSESMQIMEFFISLRVIPVSRIKSFAERTVSEVAQHLNKPARIEFTSEAGLEIDQAVVDQIENALLHFIRNSIDHGLEAFEERKTLGKAPEGTIKIDLKRFDDRVLMSYIDDGAGINLPKLVESVRKQNLVAAAALEKLTPEQMTQLIFIDGLSTRTEVTTISGRGVGLGAVKKSLDEMGASISVKTEPGKGVQFFLNLPRIFQL